MKWCNRIAKDIGVGEDASTAAKASLVYQVSHAPLPRPPATSLTYLSLYTTLTTEIPPLLIPLSHIRASLLTHQHAPTPTKPLPYEAPPLFTHLDHTHTGCSR